MLKDTPSDDGAGASRRPAGVQLRARRSPKLIALGVLAVALGALGAAALFTSNNDRVPVLAMATDVSRGETLQQESLTTVEVPALLAAGAVPPSDVEALIGQQALSDLPQGSFPRLDHVGTRSLPDGEVLLGLRLPLGRIPVTTMPPGTRVTLVSLADETRADAIVVTLPTTINDETYVFDVRLRSEVAESLARLAATDQITVVMAKEA